MRPPPGYVFANTEPGSPQVLGPRLEATIRFDTPIDPATLGAAPFDPYILVQETGYEIHTADHNALPGSKNDQEGLTSSLDPRGYPYAMLVPANWPVAWERTDVGLAYPNLGRYVQSGGQSFLDWYDSPNAQHCRSYRTEDWEWVPPVN
jgi:LruC domain-containing protein